MACNSCNGGKAKRPATTTTKTYQTADGKTVAAGQKLYTIVPIKKGE